MTEAERIADALEEQTEALRDLRTVMAELLAEIRAKRVKPRRRGPVPVDASSIDPERLADARRRLRKAGVHTR